MQIVAEREGEVQAFEGRDVRDDGKKEILLLYMKIQKKSPFSLGK